MKLRKYQGVKAEPVSKGGYDAGAPGLVFSSTACTPGWMDSAALFSTAARLAKMLWESNVYALRHAYIDAQADINGIYLVDVPLVLRAEAAQLLAEAAAATLAEEE